jgi:cytidylate kinase
MTLVALSASYGAGGSRIGPELAERLHVPFLDRAIPAAVAEELAVPFDDAEAHDEQISANWLERLLAGLFAADLSAPVPLAAPARSAADFRSATEAILLRVAAEGQAVILGRAAAIVLRDRPHVLRVRLHGPRDRRIRQAMRLEDIDFATAQQRQRDLDRAHSTYAKHFYNVDVNDPALYHVVLDSTTIALNACVEMLVAAAIELATDTR